MAALTKKEWTLSEAAHLLQEPQHRLIYLCEKDVVIPDFSQAKGRGSSRRFSVRNILEFAVALRLRKLMVPAVFVGAILYVLRTFEETVLKKVGSFALPDSLLDAGAPDLTIVIDDKQTLFFALQSGKGPIKYFGGLDLGSLDRKRKVNLRLQAGTARFNESVSGKITLSVTKVAREVSSKSQG